MSIDAAIAEKFQKHHQQYIPKDPGRHEYRKCGYKEDKLVSGLLKSSPPLLLELEEVLFEIKTISELELDLYAKQKGYEYFSIYKKIREAGWILLPKSSPSYLYQLFSPDKNFNRKTSTSIGLLQIVPAASSVDPNFFTQHQATTIIFAIADGSTFTLVEAHAYPNAKSLLSSTTPKLR
ncbi:hypothetical protein NEHOM01_0495 [Nematocida homosporus]|uniref:uncharacterized protein n=1 Tax=Nematocida homosporus TaxID=1912981 RepID=UPI002220DE42|nr:uncharacterized protein NEHOM01_0495 [Nematocida homosporus]KAI5184944.1 hypothetical protein NEHOM01_0495 [Nematocida homosporus]